MTSIPVKKGPAPPPKVVEMEKPDNPTFVSMQRNMETELEKRRKDWEKDVQKMQQDFFQIKKPSEEQANGQQQISESNQGTLLVPPSGSEIIGIKNSKSIFSDGPDGSKVFRHRFDMHGFDPDQIYVSVEGRRITVTGRKEEDQGGHKSTRNFNRQVDVPQDVDPDKLSSFMSDDGFLTVEAPVEPREEEEVDYGLEQGTEIMYDGSGYGIDGFGNIPVGSGGSSYYRSGYNTGMDPGHAGYHMVRTVETSGGGHTPGGRQVEIRSSNPRKVVVRSRPTRTHSPPNVIYRSPSPNVIHHTTSHRSVSPGIGSRTVYHSGTSSPLTTTQVFRSSSPSTRVFGSTSPSNFLSTSPTTLLSSSPSAKTSYYHSSSSSSAVPSVTIETSSSNKPTAVSSGLSIGRFSTPMIVDLQNSKKFKLGVDLGAGYESPEVTVKLLGEKIHVHAKHEEITEGRTSKREFSREFDVPESVEANTLRASLDSHGRLHIGASVSANRNHVEALNSVVNDMPPDAEPCKIEI